MENKMIQREGFEVMDRSQMLSVEGGGLSGLVNVVRKIAKAIRVIAEFSECVDDFIEGYEEGYREARGC